MADLQELFARLNSQNAASSSSAAANQPSYHQPSVSSPIFSPSPGGPQPHHSSAILSPNSSAANTPAPEPNNNARQANSLLNLLRFNQAPAVPQQVPATHQEPRPAEAPPVHARTASDLVANFMRKTSFGAQRASAAASPVPAVRAEPSSSATENPQDLLLRLLNHPKPQKPESPAILPSIEAHASPSAADVPEAVVDDLAQDLADASLERVASDPKAREHSETSLHVFGSDSSKVAAFEAPQTTSKAPIFTYVNPFDQLSASSPRNRTPVPDRSKPAAPKMEILKPKHGRENTSTASAESKEAGLASPAYKARKLSPGPVHTPVHHPETVSEAVSELGQQVDKEIEQVLNEAEKASNGRLAPEDLSISAAEVKEMETAIHDAAVDIKKELEDESNKQALEETVPKPVADALKEVVNDVAEADIADDWEAAEAEDSPRDDEPVVKVYKFPMKAFASISVKTLSDRSPMFRSSSIMDIAKLKKDFDQIDRSLIAASKNFIVYAMAKHGGFRIIRQENGTFKQVFQNHKERVFNLAMCTSPDASPADDAPETIIGIGVNGTVFWGSVIPSREDQLDEVGSYGLVLPPAPAQDDNTSGGQLKTRAKPSSRHPEYFAVGRGKSIHIVWPTVARSPQYTRPGTGVCDTEKYLKERSLKILTGKAGKDFAFSEDDTVIVSLDKAGRMRFWDIRELTDSDYGAVNEQVRPVEVRQTLLEFNTTSPTAKSWPTSVFFFDKDRPFSKGIALRYVMVGMKQNHTFQLWDLGLGKAVQEINLPHEKESDAICSVSFHPKTGILAVGHPTRNSVYLIHVSCPRYNLPALSQAAYLSQLANKDGGQGKPLPPVNATAIMTSVTEYSFASKGQLRSLYMLNEPASSPEPEEPENSPLFELYVMHSKGICTVTLRRSDLGWKKDGEALHPVDADGKGLISVSVIRPASTQTEDTSTGGDTSAPKSSSDRSVRESIKKESSNASRQSMTPEAAMRASTLAKVESKQDAARAAIINGDKTEKKKKKRANAESASQASAATQATQPSSYAQAAQRAKSPERSVAGSTAPSNVAELEAPEWAKKFMEQMLQSGSAGHSLKGMEENISGGFTKVLSDELGSLYRRFDEDKRVQAAANAAKQDALLRLVSSTLTENVDKTLERMVKDSVRDDLLPQLLSSTTSSLDRNVAKGLKSSLETVIPQELKATLPDSVRQSLQDPRILGFFSDQVAKKVASQVEHIVATSLGSTLTPALTDLSASVERQFSHQLQQANLQRQQDTIKIDQLTNLVRGLSETVQHMAASQSDLTQKISKLQQDVVQSQATKAPSASQASASTIRSPAAKAFKTPEQQEEENITRLMADGLYEQGTMAWLHSARRGELFDSVFVRCNPAYLSEVSPLLTLSTGAVVMEAFDNHIPERLVWLDTALAHIDPRDPDIREVIPQVLDVMNQKLTATYIHLNETSAGNPLLRKISTLVSKVNDIARQVGR